MNEKLKKWLTPSNSVYSLLLIFSIVGLFCAFILTLEKFEVLKNADANLSCSINSVINCGPVLKSQQASVFGFTNTLIGLMTYPALITIAVLGLVGTKFKRWFMLGLEVGTLFGFIFAYWLLFQSAVVIGALCPYCVTTTLSVTIIFAAVTRLNIMQDNLYLPKKINKKLQSWLKVGWDKFFWLAWIIIIVGLLIIKFRSY